MKTWRCYIAKTILFIVGGIFLGLVITSMSAKITPRIPENCQGSANFFCGSLDLVGWPFRYYAVAPRGLVTLGTINPFFDFFFPGVEISPANPGFFFDVLLWSVIAGLFLYFIYRAGKKQRHNPKPPQ